ncbi:Uncharacterised protein [Mycobacterium tuberculosis]|nr:Uncharacterised protein [Mycobacterium tuberculosis]CPA35854.1 Uncharacterised protein [Mycobacterium tuberculosis]
MIGLNRVAGTTRATAKPNAAKAATKIAGQSSPV